ncbi:MAG: hypothetical protein ACXQTZ_00900 [Candidatus Alkanophagales archaeon]
MVTVAEVNEIFERQGLRIKLPYPADWEVADIKIVEKKEFANVVRVLLALRLIDGEGREISDLYYGESEVRREPKVRREAAPLELEGLKRELLPERESVSFKDEDEALRYLKGAFSHLLSDKGFTVVTDKEESRRVDVYAEKGRRKFFASVGLRADASLTSLGERMIELRREYGGEHDYAIVVPAFQEQFGVTLNDFESWLAGPGDRLSKHKIGVYAVDNKNPNIIYPLTAYPKDRELMAYFMRTTRHWEVMREQRMLKRRAFGGEGGGLPGAS